jgi:hypothetical protein
MDIFLVPYNQKVRPHNRSPSATFFLWLPKVHKAVPA